MATLGATPSTTEFPSGGSLPAGLIVMWHGLLSAIPSGWVLCDGANGTPDLRSKFVKGAAAGIDPGATGGATTHTHAGHSNHGVTQPSAHSNHAVTQPNNHADVLNHVHVQNAASVATGGLVGSTPDASTSSSVASGYSSANPTANGVAAQVHAGTAVDAHSAHSGAAVDAHSAHDTPDSQPPFFAVAYIMKL